MTTLTADRRHVSASDLDIARLYFTSAVGAAEVKGETRRDAVSMGGGNRVRRFDGGHRLTPN
jgi:hypothetical protein